MKSLWNSREAKKCKDKLDVLVYRSRLIGQEAKLCVWGGGNTSTKCEESDILGRKHQILRVKGSGSDLKASERKHFTPIYLDRVLDALKVDKMTDEQMVAFIAQCQADSKAPRSSIEALLHAFVPYTDIDHSHADAILSLTNTKNNKAIAKKVYGNELIWVPYIKPGFDLAKKMYREFQKNPKAKGAILEKHGLITWANDGETSYKLMIEMVSRAEAYIQKAAKRKKWSRPVAKTLPKNLRAQFLEKMMPVIRKTVSAKEQAILFYSHPPAVMDFVNSELGAKVSQVGPATPDHMLRTKRTSLFVKGPKNILDLKEADLAKQIKAYAAAHKKYYQKHKQNGMYMLDPYPKVILVPGIGMITTGKDTKSAQIVAEIYEHSIDVMRSASTIDQYASLSEKLAFEMDYWDMELYKLRQAPPEKELSRKVGLLTGAARGIGKAIALKLAQQGAHVMVTDIDAKKVEQVAKEINKQIGAERVWGWALDVTNEKEVQACINRMVRFFGGLDFVVSNAGIAHVSRVDQLHLNDWNQSLSVNSTGHFLVSKAAVKVLRKQNLGGSIVFVASKNVLAPGKDFGAYSAAKAAQVQLGRILAIENGDAGIRVNLINPDGVFNDSGLWDGIRESRSKTWGIQPTQLETHYQKRNLMQTAILPEDVAESALFFVSNRSSKTTGCILTVDGGVQAAFPR